MGSKVASTLIRRPVRTLALIGVLLVIAGAVSAGFRLRVPAPTGPHAVGRTKMIWTDPGRFEVHTDAPDDYREVPATFWYPVGSDSGQRAEYIPELEDIRQGLVRSDQLAPIRTLSWIVARGLAFVRDQVVSEPPASPPTDRYPVVVLSPGNGGNVAFYASIAEDLASHGYVVVGVDHPYQVTAVKLSDDSVAVYDSEAVSRGFGGPVFQERVADVRFVLDQLAELDRGEHWLGDAMDLKTIGIIGHSNGGITASEACREDDRFDSCLNMDGQHQGGPFSYRPEGGAPPQPFMYLTKETEIHPEILERFGSSEATTYRVVIPEAAHDHFSDGPLFRSAFIPFASRAGRVMDASRSYISAFFDRTLKDGEEIGEITGPIEARLQIFR